nr:STAS domain-containing protein [Nocardioides marinus]
MRRLGRGQPPERVSGHRSGVAREACRLYLSVRASGRRGFISCGRSVGRGAFPALRPTWSTFDPPPADREQHVDLTLATRDVDGTTVVTVGGEIDVYTAPKLRDKITELVAAGVYDLVIDMEAVEFLDSTGLGVLVGGLKKVRAHDGSLQLVCTQDRLLKIFRITGLAKVFVIHDSAEAALAAS